MLEGERETLVFLLFLFLAMAAWGYAVWSFIRMVAHTKSGNPADIMLNPVWWRRDEANRVLNASGLLLYRRTVSSLIAFLVFTAIAVAVAFGYI